MSEYRRDVISGRWVIMAPNRAARPSDFRGPRPERRIVAPCPFCAGQEEETPQPVAVYPSQSDAAAWQVRVVPNKYPALAQLEAPLDDDPPPSGDRQPGRGVHEVVIEAPTHVVSFAELTDTQCGLTFLAYRDRLSHLARQSELAYGLVFKNARAAGGATLEHSHSQLLAMTMVPEVIGKEVEATLWHHQRTGSCLFCEMSQQELAAGRRVVVAKENLLAFCPFASRFPYEVWVLPRGHAGHFASSSEELLADIGTLVRDLVVRFERVLDQPAYNFWLHTAPFHASGGDQFHWHLELAPRLARMAGFELGAGCLINSILPEEAARQLREAQ